MFCFRPLLAAAFLCLAPWAPAEGIGTPVPKDENATREHHQRIRAIARQAAEARERESAAEAAFTALSPAARAALLTSELDAALAKVPALPVPAADPLLAAMEGKIPLWQGEVLEVRSKGQRKGRTLPMGGLWMLDFPDVSRGSARLVGKAPDGGALFVVGDVHVELTPKGEVRPASEVVQRQHYESFLRAAKDSPTLASLQLQDRSLAQGFRLVEQKLGVPVRFAAGTRFPRVTFEAAGRPAEHLLSLLCAASPGAGGPHLVWERDAQGGVLVRPLPLGSNPLPLLARPAFVESIEAGARSATLHVGGQPLKVRELDAVPIASRGEVVGEGIVERIDAERGAVWLAVGGTRVVLTTLPAALATNRVAEEALAAPAGIYLQTIGARAGLKVTVTPSLLEHPLFVSARVQTAQEVLFALASSNGFALRRTGEDSLVVGLDSEMPAP